MIDVVDLTRRREWERLLRDEHKPPAGTAWQRALASRHTSDSHARIYLERKITLRAFDERSSDSADDGPGLRRQVVELETKVTSLTEQLHAVLDVIATLTAKPAPSSLDDLIARIEAPEMDVTGVKFTAEQLSSYASDE
jgi:hypothetical protein